MANNRLSKAKKESQLERCIAFRKEYDNHPIVKAWKEFIALPYANQMKIRSQWEEYYKAVRSTYAYERFLIQKDALKAGDIGTVKGLAEEARQQRINEDWELQMPTGTDPFEFDFGAIVRGYRQNEQKIKELMGIPTQEASANES